MSGPRVILQQLHDLGRGSSTGRAVWHCAPEGVPCQNFWLNKPARRRPSC
jgi:hypothetical protein